MNILRSVGLLVLVGLGLGGCPGGVLPVEERAEQIQVVLFPTQEGCHLSKVRVFDDLGGLYQVPGCNEGIVELGLGRSLGWVEHLGQETIGFSVYILR